MVQKSGDHQLRLVGLSPLFLYTWFQKHPKRWLALGFLIHQQFPPLHCGKESVEEGAQSLPSFITPSERLPGTSTSTLLMRVDTAEDGGFKKNDEKRERSSNHKVKRHSDLSYCAMLTYIFVDIGCYLHVHDA